MSNVVHPDFSGWVEFDQILIEHLVGRGLDETAQEFLRQRLRIMLDKYCKSVAINFTFKPAEDFTENVRSAIADCAKKTKSDVEKIYNRKMYGLVWEIINRDIQLYRAGLLEGQ